MSLFWLRTRTLDELLEIMNNPVLFYSSRQAAWRELCLRMAED